MTTTKAEEVKELYLTTLVRLEQCRCYTMKPSEDDVLVGTVTELIDRLKNIQTITDLEAIEKTIGNDSLIDPVIRLVKNKLRNKLLPVAFQKLSVLPKKFVEHILGYRDKNISEQRHDELMQLLNDYLEKATPKDIRELAAFWSEKHHGSQPRLKYHDFVWTELSKRLNIYQNGKTIPFFDFTGIGTPIS